MVVNKNAPSLWLKAVLIPCWIVQVIFGLAIIVYLSLELGSVIEYQDEEDYSLHRRVKIIYTTSIAFTGLCLVSSAVEILLFTRQALKPAIFLEINLVKSSAWTILLAVNIIAILRVDHRSATISGVALELVLLVACYIALAHSILSFHHQRRSPYYASVNAPLMTQAQPNPHLSIISRSSNTSYDTYASLPSNGTDLESQPTTLAASEPDSEAGPNLLSAPPVIPIHTQRPSYDHARDPRFDQYLARRASTASRISDVGGESVYSGSGRPSLTSWGSYSYLGRMGAYDDHDEGADMGTGSMRSREEIGMAGGGEEEPRRATRDLTRRKSSGTPIIIAIDEVEEER